MTVTEYGGHTLQIIPDPLAELGANAVQATDPDGNDEGDGIRFAVFAGDADRVELCLFPPWPPRQADEPDPDWDARAHLDQTMELRLEMPGRSEEGVFHGRLSGSAFGRPVGPGLRYAYRVHGRWDPVAGLRHNGYKLVLDPMARRLDRPFRPDGTLFAHIPPDGEALAEDPEASMRTLTPDHRQNHAALPRCVVCLPGHPKTPRPHIPASETVIYEAHAKGLTKAWDAVPAADRGRYAGLAAPAVAAHLTRIGVTALELLPVAAALDEPHLWPLGLSNYWGYNPAVFTAPNPALGVPEELRAAIDKLHDAGLEVLLDVVFNHGAEGGSLGPAVSFRGLDNRAWYRASPASPTVLHNDSGCGNVLDLDHPMVLRHVMDALRLWVIEYGVDGFRFDLTATLMRSNGTIDRTAPFLAAVMQDPVLRQVKLIAEPWDLGPDGYQAGGFPKGWMEWNDAYRDPVRQFWLGPPGITGLTGGMATALAGSSPRFLPSDRSPHAAINFVACHDGYTLADLTAYEDKHNWANGEDNRDGSGHETSRHFGVEGHSTDPEILARRKRAQRALLASVYLSLGVPMIAAGDEFGRSQNGNNNAYCQDNALSWLNWSDADPDLIGFTQAAAFVRKRIAALRNGAWLQPDQDVIWLHPSGRPMADPDWGGDGRAFAMRLCPPLTGQDHPSQPDLLVLMNAGEDRVAFQLPEDRAWEPVLSAEPNPERDEDKRWVTLLPTDLRAFISV